MASRRGKDSPADAPARLITADDFKRLPWRSVGPAIMGGRVADMAFVPGDYKSYYVGYATGGLWRTVNHGTTFEPLFDKEETSSIGSIAVCHAPADWKGWEEDVKKSERAEKGKGKIIWVGTGEGNGRNSSSWGNGVYRSTDGGKKWVHLGLENTHDIPRLAVDPRDPDVCYIAALGHLWGHNEDRGVYKTTDGGKTWDKVLYIDEKTGACDVIVDPKNPDVVYAAMYMRLRKAWSFVSGGPEGGIYKSTDAGKTWKKLSGGLPAQTGRIGLDIFAGDTNKLIAVVESTENGGNSIRDDRMRGGGVFRSDDGGETWRRLSVRSPRAFYFSKIKFDPSNDQRVYMLGWTTEVSDDGGATFREGWGDIIHADHHAILVDPTDPKHIIVGSDGGIYQTFDQGANWDFLNTHATGQFYNISLDMSEPYRIIGGLQDNGTWVWPSATGKQEDKDDAQRVPQTGITNGDIDFVLWGDGFHADFDPTDRDVVFGEWQGGNLTRVNLRTGEKRFLSPEAREGQARHRYNWNAPFFVSQHNPGIIYHGGNRVYKVATDGTKWEAISDDLTTKNPDKMDTAGSQAETHCTLVSLAESPRTPGELWAGSDDGLVHVTRDEGKTWSNVTPPTGNGRYVARLQPSAHAEGRCYVCLDGHRDDHMDPCVMVTEDFGKTWTDITGDLPPRRSAKVIREDQVNPNVLYVGTENALYVSFNRGQSYVKLHGKALPTVPVDDIKQHPRDTDVVIATHGRSVWILDDAHWIGEMTPEAYGAGLHLFTVRPAAPRWFIPYNGLWSHKMFRAPNPPMGIKIDYWVGSYTGEDVSIVIEDAKGVEVKKLSGGNAAGYHRVVWNLQPHDWLKAADQGEDSFMEFHARPGIYKVKISMGELKQEGTFEVLARKG